MKIRILDEDNHRLRTLACNSRLDGHEVEIRNDRIGDVDVRSGRLRRTEAQALQVPMP